jgi:hypothetical protein
MPPSLAEYLSLAFGILLVLGLTTCIAFLWALCYFMVVFFHHFSPLTREVSPAPEAAVVVPIAEAKQKKEMPGKSCGHCGVRIKGDPARALMVDGNSYHVYVCPVCKKETLLSVKLV